MTEEDSIAPEPAPQPALGHEAKSAAAGKEPRAEARQAQMQMQPVLEDVQQSLTAKVSVPTLTAGLGPD